MVVAAVEVGDRGGHADAGYGASGGVRPLGCVSGDTTLLAVGGLSLGHSDMGWPDFLSAREVGLAQERVFKKAAEVTAALRPRSRPAK